MKFVRVVDPDSLQPGTKIRRWRKDGTIKYFGIKYLITPDLIIGNAYWPHRCVLFRYGEPIKIHKVFTYDSMKKEGII